METRAFPLLITKKEEQLQMVKFLIPVETFETVAKALNGSISKGLPRIRKSLIVKHWQRHQKEGLKLLRRSLRARLKCFRKSWRPGEAPMIRLTAKENAPVRVFPVSSE